MDEMQNRAASICKAAWRRHIPSSAGHHRPKQKLVKDPNLVSALAGHVEGSRAFTRYRTIDIDMKKNLVKILEGKQ